MKEKPKYKWNDRRERLPRRKDFRNLALESWALFSNARLIAAWDKRKKNSSCWSSCLRSFILILPSKRDLCYDSGLAGRIIGSWLPLVFSFFFLPLVCLALRICPWKLCPAWAIPKPRDRMKEVLCLNLELFLWILPFNSLCLEGLGI